MIRALAATACFFLASCATTQSRYAQIGSEYPPQPEQAHVEVFLGSDLPDRPFEKISRIDVHLEKTHFVQSGLANALPELKKQARLSGAEAIIDIRERASTLLETRIYHVTATGIRYR